MPEKPLLIFPTPTPTGRWKRKGGGAPKELVKPTNEEQRARLQPKFEQLARTLEAQTVRLQTDVAGVDPEMVLVFETRGTIDEFIKALRRMPGMEWMGEVDQDFPANEFFHYEDEAKPITGRLYFIMSNQTALVQLKSLWDNYYVTGERFPFGFTKWRDLFGMLNDVRPWGLRDRIEETGLLEDWNQRIIANQETIHLEIELWYRETPNQRATTKGNIENHIAEIDGEILQESVIGGIGYHALLVKVPIGVFNDLYNNNTIRLLAASDIMFMRPVGQCAVNYDPAAETIQEDLERDAPILNDPKIALFDGLPMQNHQLLNNRLTIDDPDNFQLNYTAIARQHGTAMASLILHGDLNFEESPLKFPLYVRPIMQPDISFGGTPVEYIPQNLLLVDLIHKAVKRLYENDGAFLAAAPNVKVINLSIGDPARVFNGALSSLAKLVDWLSFKYNVLFIISAGNSSENIAAQIPVAQIDELIGHPERLSELIVRYIYDNIRHKRIISPGESVNGLTVGASHSDNHGPFTLQNRINLFTDARIFSPISRFGLGFRRSIKPDVLMPGGRFLYRQAPGQSIDFAAANFQSLAPGIKVASPSAQGNLNGYRFTHGTSNSAALLTRTAGKVYENFIDTEELNGTIDLNEYFPVIAKSLLTHSASWDTTSRQLILRALSFHEGNKRDLLARLLGFGIVNPNTVVNCTEQKVTLVGYGSLSPEEGHLFRLPMPFGISGQVFWRKLTITLAWITPINPFNQKYRSAALFFDFPDQNLTQLLEVSRTHYDDNTVKRGTIQHEIFEGSRATVFNANSDLGIRVSCKEDASTFQERIKYALSVTLEINETVAIDIYNEIRLRIQQPVVITP
ncbi:Subtilase family protein [Chryseolinea serpens]|uniref:Subtilase family protein n=1 Tax=Chryseolinea serpens TaxID=947013 RepID=A0A1M5WT04_9BACT|nr:S8 family peptidase [Chryseolinea serpens]SHH90630.1 Subtilase family protein [Chryseolinea serpens]